MYRARPAWPRSIEPALTGNDMDTYADDLAELTEKLGLENAVHVGHSTGGVRLRAMLGDTAQSVWRKRANRLRPAAAGEDAGQSRRSAAQCLRWHPSRVQADRSQFFKDLTLPFYGYNRPAARPRGVRESFWLQGMMAGFPQPTFASRLSPNGSNEDLKRMDIRRWSFKVTMIKLCRSPMPGAPGEAHPECEAQGIQGAPHGLCTTMKDQVNEDLLAFIRA